MINIGDTFGCKGNKIALKSYHGKYIEAENGGGGSANANRDDTGTWESFTVEELGGNKVFLKSFNNKYHYLVTNLSCIFIAHIYKNI